jgi:hypothetical protein
MAKVLLGLLVAWLAWRLWYHGPNPMVRRPPPGRPLATEDPRLAEARAVLGLDARASEADVRAAHRRLIAAVHPDRGGSAELARRINEARDALLRHPSDRS